MEFGLKAGYCHSFALGKLEVRTHARREFRSVWFGLHLHGLDWRLPFELQRLGTRLVRLDGRFRCEQAFQTQPVHGFEIGLFVLSRTVPVVKKSYC